MHLRFTLSQSKAANRTYRTDKTYKTQLKNAARLVAVTELPQLQELELSVVFLSDSELLAINRTSLGHDWLTDIITFELERTPTTLEAEIYISIDRARENAKQFRATLKEELKHLVIHGLLHLAGMKDKTAAQKKQMRARERWYLAKLSEGV